MKQITTGSTLTAIDPCRMISGKNLLTVGKDYTVTSHTDSVIYIVNDHEGVQAFAFESLLFFFKLPEVKKSYSVVKGTVLTAIDPCTMGSGENALTVGKDYTVIELTNKRIFIKSNTCDNHEYSFNSLLFYFKAKEVKGGAVVHAGK